MPKKYDVVAITGEYNGKPRYQNVGLVIEKDGKFYLKMNHLVTPHENGNVVSFFNLFTPTPKEDKPHQKPGENLPEREYESGGGFDDGPDGIPF